MRRLLPVLLLCSGLGSVVGPGCSRDPSRDGELTSATGFCAETCLKPCSSDDDCDPSRGQVCGDYGDDGQACVAAKESPRLCDSDRECEGSEGEACLRTVVTTTQRECTVPYESLSLCSRDSDCATEDGDKCCNIYTNPICLPASLCPTSCKKDSECDAERGETCCTSLSAMDPALDVAGLCIDPTEESCPVRCESSRDCSDSKGELCCNEICSTTCEKACQTSDDCPGQICCKTRAARSPFRLRPKVGYRVSSRTVSGSGGAGGTTGGSQNAGGRSTGGAPMESCINASQSCVYALSECCEGLVCSASSGHCEPARESAAGASGTGGRSETGGAGEDPTGGMAGSGARGVTGGTIAIGGNPFTGGGGTGGQAGAGDSGGTGGNPFSSAGGGNQGSGGTATNVASTNPTVTDGFGTAITGQQGYWYTAGDDASTIYPACPDPCFSQSGSNICVSGEIRSDPPITSWGILVVWNIAQPEGEDTMAGTTDLSAYAGVTVGLECAVPTSKMRAEIEVADKTIYCTRIMCDASNVLLFADFEEDCWDPTGIVLDPARRTAVRRIRIMVYPEPSSTTPFDFCVTEVSFLG